MGGPEGGVELADDRLHGSHFPKSEKTRPAAGRRMLQPAPAKDAIAGEKIYFPP